MWQHFYLTLNLGLCVLWVKYCTRVMYLTITELPHLMSVLVRFDLSGLSFLSPLKETVNVLLLNPSFPKSLSFLLCSHNYRY